jgi:peroxiredoxin
VPTTRPHARFAARAAALAVTGGVAAAMLAGCGGSSRSGGYQYTGATKFGTVIPAPQRKPAEAFTGELLDGGTYKLADQAGKAVVVNFWGTWCGPCTTETPEFDKIYRSYKNKNVTFVGIDVKDTKGFARSFVQQNHISYPIVFDEKAETALKLGNVPSASMPFTVLIDRQHRVAGVYIGPMQAKDLDPLLNKVVAEKA